MRYLAAVDTVHTAATLCDYLGGRVDVDDEVIALTVHDDAADADDAGGSPATDAERDRQEALNVIGVRLAIPAVETVERRGVPAEGILDAAHDRDVDEIVCCVRGGGPDAGDGVGSTTTSVLDAAHRPVVVLPQPQF